MQVILDYIWTMVKTTLKKRILVVDEAWYLMQHKDSAEFLRGIVKRGRKYYLGVTTITQDVDDFLKTPYGKEIVTNSSIQILLKQHSAAINLIGETFYLSQGERQLLLSADKGEGIFFAGANHVAIRIIASEEENKLITSDPEEILKMKQQKDKIVASIKTETKKEIPKELPKESSKKLPPELPPLRKLPPLKEEAPLKNNNWALNNENKKIEQKPTEKIEEVKIEEKQIEPKIEEIRLEDKNLEKKQEIMSDEVVIPILQRRINEMENKNKKETDKFHQDRDSEIKEKESQKKNFDSKFKELFKGLEEMKEEDKTTKKPVFMNQEAKIPQPPQLQKKVQPIFEKLNNGQEETIKSVPLAKIPLEKKPVDLKTGKVVEENTKEDTKTNYDDLFGNGIV
jgi:hypothetical protein